MIASLLLLYMTVLLLGSHLCIMAVGPCLCSTVVPAWLVFLFTDLLLIYCPSSGLQQANPQGNDLDLSSYVGLIFSSRDSLLQWSNTEKRRLVLTFPFLAFAFCPLSASENC